MANDNLKRIKATSNVLPLGNAQFRGNYAQTNWPYLNQQLWRPTDVREDYANDVEVDENEHDVTLRFYRTKGENRKLVHTLTLPKTVFKKLSAKK